MNTLDERVDGFIWFVGLLSLTVVAGGFLTLAAYGAYTLL